MEEKNRFIIWIHEFFSINQIMNKKDITYSYRYCISSKRFFFPRVSLASCTKRSLTYLPACMFCLFSLRAEKSIVFLCMIKVRGVDWCRPSIHTQFFFVFYGDYSSAKSVEVLQLFFMWVSYQWKKCKIYNTVYTFSSAGEETPLDSPLFLAVDTFFFFFFFSSLTHTCSRIH